MTCTKFPFCFWSFCQTTHWHTPELPNFQNFCLQKFRNPYQFAKHNWAFKFDIFALSMIDSFRFVKHFWNAKFCHLMSFVHGQHVIHFCICQRKCVKLLLTSMVTSDDSLRGSRRLSDVGGFLTVNCDDCVRTRLRLGLSYLHQSVGLSWRETVFPNNENTTRGWYFSLPYLHLHFCPLSTHVHEIHFIHGRKDS